MGSRWQVEKHKDPYYKRAKQEDYRSRASYKLKQLDKKFYIWFALLAILGMLTHYYFLIIAFFMCLFNVFFHIY